MKRPAFGTVARFFVAIIVCSFVRPAAAGALLYVTHQNDDNVRVSDTATNTLVDTITVGDSP